MLYGKPKPDPEPEPLEIIKDPTRLTPEQQLYAWRLLELTSAAGQAHGVTLADLNWLTFIARSRCDLHQACEALAAGCTVKQAVDIFT